MGVIAVTQGYCEAVLQSSTEQLEQHFAKNSVAVHWCWITAHLYDQQIFTGANAVTQGCCQAVLQSSTEQWEQHFAQGSAAVHYCWVTAHMYCQAAMKSSTEQWVCILPKPVLQCIGVGSLHTCMISKSSWV